MLSGASGIEEGLRNHVAVGMQLAIDAKEMPEIRRLLSDVKSARLIDNRALGLGHPLLHQQVLGPGGIHHFHPVTVRSAEILVQAPAEGSVSQMDQPDFAQNLEHHWSPSMIDLDVNHDRNRAVVGRRNMNQLVRRPCHRRRLEIERTCKIDR